MSSFGLQVYEAAEARLGAAFANHFEPNICDTGRVTHNQCMEVGFGEGGVYDCSGLIIASMCEVEAIDPRNANPAIRHAKQMMNFTKADHRPEVGDVVLFYGPDRSRRNILTAQHVAILGPDKTLIHASMRSMAVVREDMLSGRQMKYFVPIDEMAQQLSSADMVLSQQ